MVVMNILLQALLAEIAEQYQGQIPDIVFDMAATVGDGGLISIIFPRTLSTPDIPGIQGYRGTEIKIWVDEDERLLTVDVGEFNVYAENDMGEIESVGGVAVFRREFELARPSSMEDVMRAVEEGLFGSAEVRQLLPGWWLRDD